MKTHRILFLGVLFFVLIIGLCYRLVNLHLVEDEFLKSKGDATAHRTLDLKSYRGLILDRNGQALAVSTPVKSIWVNVNQVDLSDKNWGVLARKLNFSKKDIVRKIKAHPHISFLYLKRHITPILSEKILNLKLAGVYAQTEYRRFYPTGEIFSQIVGHTGIDHTGQEGIELAYNAHLRGQSGHHKVLKDRAGHSVESLGKKLNPTLGADVVLSLDTRIQYLAYKELLAACFEHKAKSASLVVLDVDSFEVLAMVNVPSYNPNNLNNPKLIRDYIRNRAVTDQFEPGSVIKPFTMVHVLETTAWAPTMMVDTTPGFMHIGSKLVKDVHNYGNLDLTQIIQKSSNVGIAKLVLPLGAHNLYKVLDAVGFGNVTDSGFPGERSGRILDEGRKNNFALATLAFGYAMTVTPLQLAQSYAVLAAGGIKRPLSFIKSNNPGDLKPADERVLDGKITNMVNQMLAATSETGGTAYKARVPGYTVAGKTGTVRKIENNGYSEDKHIAIFAGFAPLKHPKLAIAVIIDEPEVKYYGGEVAAPVFSKVMEGALRILAVPRDNNLLN